MSRIVDAPDVLERFHAQLALVEIIAAQVVRSVGTLVEFDDLVGTGREGLLDAARRFDPARGVPFRAYANIRVYGAMLDALRQLSALPRRAYERIAALEAAALVSEGEAEQTFAQYPAVEPSAADQALAQHLSTIALAAAVEMATEERGEAGDGDTPEDALSRAELVQVVRGALNELSTVEAEVVRRHYFDGERLEDIARDLDMSKSWASRVQTRAVARLAKRLRNIA